MANKFIGETSGKYWKQKNDETYVNEDELVKITDLDESDSVEDDDLLIKGNSSTGTMLRIKVANFLDGIKEKLLGNTDISSVGDGTVTGAISENAEKISENYDELNSALAVSTGTPEMQGSYTSSNYYLVKYGKVVACYFQVQAASTSSSGDTVAYLPSGFRPSSSIYCPIANATATSGACYGRIFTTGEVRLYYTSDSSATINCFISCTFITS